MHHFFQQKNLCRASCALMCASGACWLCRHRPQGRPLRPYCSCSGAKRIMLRPLVTFSFPHLPITQLLVPFLQSEPPESSRVCVHLAEEKEKEECCKGNGLLQIQMIRPLVCDLGFHIQLFPCKEPPGGKKETLRS